MKSWKILVKNLAKAKKNNKKITKIKFEKKTKEDEIIYKKQFYKWTQTKQITIKRIETKLKRLKTIEDEIENEIEKHLIW